MKQPPWLPASRYATYLHYLGLNSGRGVQVCLTSCTVQAQQQDIDRQMAEARLSERDNWRLEREQASCVYLHCLFYSRMSSVPEYLFPHKHSECLAGRNT